MTDEKQYLSKDHGEIKPDAEPFGGRSMTNEDKEQIAKLIEAGDKLPKKKLERNKNTNTIYIVGVPNSTMRINPEHTRAVEKLLDYTVVSANTRPAIKAMAEENERLKLTLKAILIQSEFFAQEGTTEELKKLTLEQINILAKQALGETNEI